MTNPAAQHPDAEQASPTTGLLRTDAVVRVFDGRTVLDGLTLAVAPGHRLGVVGENGAGKTTLLRLLAGSDEPDSGSVTRPAELAFLTQEPTFGPRQTIRDVMAEATAAVVAIEQMMTAAATALAARPDDPVLVTAFADALAAAELAAVWDVERRATMALAGLGIGEISPERATAALSGGERSRLALAALLVRSPAAVLLDEPTNHLDDAAAEYLAGALRALPGAVVLTSHDRVFLDEVCTEYLDLDPAIGPPVQVGGTFTDYLAAAAAAREQWQQRWLAERAQAAALRHSVAVTARDVSKNAPMTDHNKMGYHRYGDRVASQVSRRVANAQRRLDTLTTEQVRKPPQPLRFRPPVGRRGGTALHGLVIQLRGVEMAWGSGETARRITLGNLDLAGDASLLVTGPNGAGKSTLLHLLAGDITPTVGTVQRSAGIEVALLEQDVGLASDLRTPRALYTAVTADLRDAPPLTDLGLVAPRDLDRPMAALSVGQRRRVVLALVVARTPDVLLLDEPTNHISIRLADELAEALGTAPGAVVVASHDRWLRRRWQGTELRLG